MEETDGVLCFVFLQNCNRSGMQFISNSYVHELHMFYYLSCILFSGITVSIFILFSIYSKQQQGITQGILNSFEFEKGFDP